MDTPPRNDDLDDDRPIKELQDLAVESDEDLEGRVMRDINRRTLAAHSLEFSLSVMIGTFWEHLQAVIESIPGMDPSDKEDDHG